MAWSAKCARLRLWVHMVPSTFSVTHVSISPSVFAALLDPEKGGYFCIQPELDGESSKQLYLPDTNILVTRFLSEHGIAEISDFMPILKEDVQPTHPLRACRAGRDHLQARVLATVRLCGANIPSKIAMMAWSFGPMAWIPRYGAQSFGSHWKCTVTVSK